MRNVFGMRCRVCGVVDDQPGEDVLEPHGYDLEWVHYSCMPIGSDEPGDGSAPSGGPQALSGPAECTDVPVADLPDSPAERGHGPGAASSHESGGTSGAGL